MTTNLSVNQSLPNKISIGIEKSEKEITRLVVSPDYKMNAAIAFQSGLPTLSQIGRHKEIMVRMSAIFSRYIGIYHPGTEHVIVADEVTELLMEIRPDWNVYDIQAFINFMKKNKPDTSGHKITPTEIIESSNQYEQTRLDEIEKKIHNDKISHNGNMHTSVLERLETYINGLEKKQSQNVNEKVDDANKINLEKTTKFHLLKVRFEKKEITEKQLMDEWNSFLKQLQNERH